jgi:membrane protein YdbS with pleckstrin-like domain
MITTTQSNSAADAFSAIGLDLLSCVRETPAKPKRNIAPFEQERAMKPLMRIRSMDEDLFEGAKPRPLCEAIPIAKRQVIRRAVHEIVSLLGRRLGGVLILMLVIDATLIFSDELSAAQDTMLASLALFVCSATIVFCYSELYVRSVFFDIDASYLSVRKGIILRKELIIPLRRISNIASRQDLLGKCFGLCDVSVWSWGDDSARVVSIEGLSRTNAGRLREIITRAIGQLSKDYTH